MCFVLYALNSDITLQPPTWEVDDLPFYYCARPVAAVLNVNRDIAAYQPGGKLGEPAFVQSIEGPVRVAFDTSLTNTVPGSESNLEFRLNMLDGARLALVGDIGIQFPGPATQEIAIQDPVGHFARIVQFYKPKAKVQIVSECSGKIQQQWHSDLTLVQMMNFTLLVSDNTYAELFQRQLGALERVANASLRSENAQTLGIAKIRSILMNQMQVSPSLFRQADGSGVSRQTFASPAALTGLLKYMLATQPIFEQLLPVAGTLIFFCSSYSRIMTLGETGTLKHRFLDHKGILSAKTGTLSGVDALSGYIRSIYYEKMIFSIIVNNSALSAADVRKVIDKIAIYLAFTDPSC